MKYLPLQALDDVASALNFETADVRVVGGCDIYTTKAAGGDKKLYRNIEHSLESQYESALRISASLSPPQASHAAAALNLSRSSPFGPLSQVSSRRTFAYMIATLNATDPDYDFSHNARPSDFRRERNLRVVMNALDTTLLNLRPKPGGAAGGSGSGGTGGAGAGGAGGWVGGPPHWSAAPPDAPPPPVGPTWQPSKAWRLIDKEMSLRECGVYCYAPDEQPWTDADGDEPALWSVDYFFFNKARKRVCYFYLRGYSLFGDDDAAVPRTPMSARSVAAGLDSDDDDSDEAEPTSRKRAAFWLGSTVAAAVDESDAMHDDEPVVGKEPRLLSPDDERMRPGREASEAETPESDASERSERPVRRTRARTRLSKERELSEEMVAGDIEM